MATYISLLRGINVRGQKKILMKDLCEMYTSLGFENVTSYVQSGNVVFSARKQSLEGLARKLEAGIQETFAFDVPTLVVDSNYLEQVIRNNPFREETVKDAKLPYVLFRYEKPGEVELEPPTNETASLVLSGRVIYLYYPDGAGRSTLTTNFFEGKLKVTATARNWKTVLALYAMAQLR